MKFKISNFKYQILNSHFPKLIGNCAASGKQVLLGCAASGKRPFGEGSPLVGQVLLGCKLKIKNSLVKQERGVTLIELIIYMGIFSTLLMVMVQLFGTIVNVSLESQANAAVSQDGRYILNQLSYTIRQAQTFTTPSGFGSANAGSQLQLTTTGGTSYTYSLSTDPVGQKKLLITSGGVSEQLNSTGTTVSNLSFTRYKTTGTSGKSMITISFTLTSTTREQKGYQQENFQTTVAGR